MLSRTFEVCEALAMSSIAEVLEALADVAMMEDAAKENEAVQAAGEEAKEDEDCEGA